MLVSVVPAAESANSPPHTEKDMEWERWAQWAQEAKTGESTQFWIRRSDYVSSKPVVRREQRYPQKGTRVMG